MGVTISVSDAIGDHMAEMGRPTTYKPEYCEALIKHMSQGLSFESFSATIGTHRGVLYQWEAVHSDFADAKQRGHDLCLIMWEKMGVVGAAGKNKTNPALWIFNMKNRFRWVDRHEISGNPTATIKLSYDVDSKE